MSKQVVTQEALRQVLENIGALFVRKDGSKVLSTNDFTSAYKNMLDNLNQYALTPATAQILGGIKVGTGLAVAQDGTLSLGTLEISDITGLATVLAAAASADDLADLAGLINDELTGLDSKAAKVDLQAIASKVNHNSTGLDQRLLTSVFTSNKTTTDNAIAAKVDQSAYNTKVSELETAIGNKVASSALFDGNNQIKSELLPSYVDDVIEGYYDSTTGNFYSDSEKTTAITGETGKIYLDKPSNCSYRFGGSTYVLITSADIEMMSAFNVNAVFNDVFNTNLATE